MSRIRLHAALLAMLLAASPVLAQADPSALDALSVEALKSSYLLCDRVTSGGRMDPATAIRCTQVSDALLRREFRGDFDLMIAWWRAEKARVLRASTR